MEFNIIIDNDALRYNRSLLPLLFDKEALVFVEPSWDMYDILVHCKLFKSKSDARKNWNKTTQVIPDGFTDIERIGKLRHRLTIFNPISIENE
jgi:hypothetical protein